MNRGLADRATLLQGPSGTRVAVALREASLQTDELTLSIAHNQRELENFAQKYELTMLLTPEARATFAAMTEQELKQALKFLQLALHIGWRSLEQHARMVRRLKTGQSDTAERLQALKALVAVSKEPGLLGDRVWRMFGQMSPRARRAAALIVIESLRAAGEAPGPGARDTQASTVKRIVARF